MVTYMRIKTFITILIICILVIGVQIMRTRKAQQEVTPKHKICKTCGKNHKPVVVVMEITPSKTCPIRIDKKD